MALLIDIRAEGITPKITRRKIQKLKTAMLSVIASQWHSRFAAGHFTTGGARRYRYRKRLTKEVYTGKIIDKKRALSGKPLVHKGETRRKAKRRTIRANSKRSAAVVPIGHINRYRPKKWPPGQMRFEFTTVLVREERELGKHGEQFARRLFTKRKSNITVTQSRL